MVFHAAGALPKEDHIVQIVLDAPDPLLPGKGYQIVTDGLGVSGPVGDGAELFKAGKHFLRLNTRQFLCFHIISSPLQSEYGSI